MAGDVDQDQAEAATASPAGSSFAGSSSAGAALAGALSRKPGAQTRAGQDAMCAAVEAALAGAGHLLVEAPTGTGKSLAYLVPAVRHALSGEGHTVVVVTATKALQEQLVGEDLPFLAGALDGPRFDYAMLKGRSNYLCRAKLDVTLTDGVEGRLDFGSGGPLAALEQVGELGAWAEDTATGDRADAPGVVSDAVWSQVSVDPGECPGAAKCHAGDRCFAETARARAAGADIVVVNTHLYASHVASGGYVLPPHDAVVFDEAHTLEDVFAEALGVRLSPGRVRRVASRLRGAGADVELARRLERAAGLLEEALALLAGTEPTRVTPTEGDLARALGVIGTLAGDAAGALRRLAPAGDAARAKVAQAGRLVDGLAGNVIRLLDPASYTNQVAWVEKFRDRAELHLAIIDVGPVLAGALYPNVTVIATSATLATGGRFEGLARRLGLSLPAPDGGGREPVDQEVSDLGTPIARSRAIGVPRTGVGSEAAPDAPTDPGLAGAAAPPRFSALAVPSPFDHPRQGFLYVARHLPEPNDPAFSAAMHEELHALISAAGGRTLALFTSRAAMERAAEALGGRDGYEIVVQDRLPRPELLARFRSGPGLALFATQSFWQGVDLPGSLCHLVTIDRIPFPRPTDPLVQARREAAEARSANAFATVDVPIAATLLAQGSGRLIRTTTDQGVVAVFDRRLATRSYRATLLATMPPLRRTIDRDQVLAALGILRPGMNLRPMPDGARRPPRRICRAPVRPTGIGVPVRRNKNSTRSASRPRDVLRPPGERQPGPTLDGRNRPPPVGSSSVPVHASALEGTRPLSVTRKGWGRLINTPYGQARVNDKGLVMWAEWEVWLHASEMVEDGLWRSQPSASRTRQRTEFYAVEVHAVAEDRPGCRATKTTDPASSLGATESEGT